MSTTTHIGNIRLKVKDLKKSIEFYSKILGFDIVEQTVDLAKFSCEGNKNPLIMLQQVRYAVPKPRNTTGLYHFAIRLPTEQSLANLLTNIIKHDWPIQGAADHIVSKAIYFVDPDGNGIEIYADRPQELWEWHHGEVAMSTAYLDINALLRQSSNKPETRKIIPQETIIGHVHLTVSSLEETAYFYHNLIGLDITQRSYPGALFFSAGGYHHHIGTNTWSGKDISAPPVNATGLQSFSIDVPESAVWANILSRLHDAHYPQSEEQLENQFKKIKLSDPSGNHIEIRTPN